MHSIDLDYQDVAEVFYSDPGGYIEKFFWAPTSIKLDADGRVYVTESNRHRIQIYAPNR